MTRHGLLVTAVATVTVPGLLAVMAVLGHEHGAVAGATATLGGTQLSGPFPVAPTAARAAVRDNVAAVQRVSGMPLTVLSRETTGQRATGMHLLALAAKASLATSYQGTELVSESDVGGTAEVVSQVWHKGGGATLVETADSATPVTKRSLVAHLAATAEASADPATGSPEGVFGITKDLVAQLGKHYVAVYQGHGSAAGKSASIVEVYRFDGSLAARYWLDRKTMVPLRRELYDTTDKVISEDSFVQVQYGALTQQAQAAQAAQPAQSAWVAASAPATYLTSLTGQGLRVPATLPGGLPLYKAASTKATSGEIVDLEYSDGLYVVSLFVERGTLAANMPGWREVSVAGQQAYVSGHSVTWAGPGYVYTVIADAPPQTVTQVVQALPRSGSPGVLDRLGRGFLRLAQVINPFG